MIFLAKGTKQGIMHCLPRRPSPSYVALGGLIQNGSVTEANFLEMLGILLITETPIRVQKRGTSHIITSTNNQLGLGEYDVYCNSKYSSRSMSIDASE